MSFILWTCKLKIWKNCVFYLELSLFSCNNCKNIAKQMLNPCWHIKKSPIYKGTNMKDTLLLSFSFTGFHRFSLLFERATHMVQCVEFWKEHTVVVESIKILTFITGFVTRVTRRVPLVGQELFTYRFGHCVDCASIYGFWLSLWYLQTLPIWGEHSSIIYLPITLTVDLKKM